MSHDTGPVRPAHPDQLGPTHDRPDPAPAVARVDVIRRVLIYHVDALSSDGYELECLCGWHGESWADHVAPLIDAAISDAQPVDKPVDNSA